MVKQGPCRHCGVTSTPLWRNGPAEKPVLCNACGSRWRTKGSLTNYTPLHSRAEPDEFTEYGVQRMKAISIKYKEEKVLKRKQIHDVEVAARVAPDHGFQKGARDALDYKQKYLRTLDEDTSNRSSSGSAISNSDSFVHLGSADASDLTGAAQSTVRDNIVPSRKRTCVGRAKPSSVEKLTKDLYAILQEQQTYFSGSTEEDLLLECDTPVVSVEIGHGSVLIRHPSSIAREEESEASSLSVFNKPHPANEACSQFTTLRDHTFNKFDNFSSARIERKKKPGQEKELELYKRKDQQEKLEILENLKSSICSIELEDTKCKSRVNGSSVARGNAAVASAQLLEIKRACDGQLQNLTGVKKVVKTNYELRAPMDNDATCFSPKSLLEAPRDSTCLMLDPFQFADESSDHDLLLNIPSHSSFPQAELLLPNSGFGAQASTSSSSLYQNHVPS